MKYLLLKTLLLLSIFSKPSSDFDNFIEFAVRNFDPPESVKRICIWQYAIIKLEVNKANRVTNYQVMNAVSPGITASLSHLKGYQFDKKIHINQRPVVFCLGLESTRTGYCDTITPRTHPRALTELKNYRLSNKAREKHSIFINVEALKIIEDPTP